MAVAALADEVLQMILAASLTIPQQQFVSSSLTTFGENDVVSSASVLLVCKKWLRVATPLLYETVIIRSTGQTHALARVFRCNSVFATYVKKLRLEGSYASLEAILPKCRNLVTLVLLLHIYSDAEVAGLCRSLSLINPTEVILHDPKKNNIKVRKVLVSLCDAIPRWTNLTSFEYPYGQFEGNRPLDAGSTVPRSERIVDALAQSKSLQKFYCPLSQLDGVQWRRLASVSSVAFKFRCYSFKRLDPEHLMTLARKKTGSTAAITNSIEFIDTSKTRSTAKKNCSDLGPLTQSFRFDTIPDNIWSRIISFAALPGYPNPPEVYCDHLFNEPWTTVDAKRRALSLTCKKFERLVRPIHLSFPIFPTLSSFERFTENIIKAPHLGRQVKVLSLLSFCFLFYMNRATEAQLLTLIPYLTSLLHFDSRMDLLGSLGIGIITRLSKAAGGTLLTLKGFDYTPSQSFSLATLASFKQLRTLDFPKSNSATHVYSTLGPNSFPYLRNLRINGPGQFFDTLCTMRLPALKSVWFAHAPIGTIGRFLHVSGANIQDLCFVGFDNLAEIFRLTPNLLYMEWELLSDHAKQSSAIYEALSEPSMHEKLEILTFRDVLHPGSGEKEQNNIVDAIFSHLDLMKFPSLKEIRFPEYIWPLEERSISRQSLPKKAIEFKKNNGIDITDRSEKPWRPRVQRGR